MKHIKAQTVGSNYNVYLTYLLHAAKSFLKS